MQLSVGPSECLSCATVPTTHLRSWLYMGWAGLVLEMAVGDYPKLFEYFTPPCDRVVCTEFLKNINQMTYMYIYQLCTKIPLKQGAESFFSLKGSRSMFFIPFPFILGINPGLFPRFYSLGRFILHFIQNAPAWSQE